MPLSTSSSSTHRVFDRLPAIDWGRRWGAALAGFLLLLLLLEGSLRSQGIGPSQSDTTLLWVATRDRLTSGDVVLAGASKSQLGLHRQRIEEVTKKSTLQLSINGMVPWAMLGHLAFETDFNGLVLLSVTPYGLTEGFSIYMGDQSDHLRAWKRMAWSSPLESWLRTRADGFLVTRRSGVSRRFLVPLGIGSNRGLPYLTMDTQRQMFADYSRRDAARFLAEGASKTVALAEDQQPSVGLFAAVREAVAQIRSRGGEVVLIRMPSSGAYREAEALRFPREKFWNTFVAQVDAPSIHFEDFPALSRFFCPDGSHLDGKDSLAFTDAMLAILVEERWSR
ncbi:MAG: hypothetical protein ABGX49_04595 [Candidatus Poseidoniia archaeon]